MTEHPFANGTEVEAWQSKWCDLCVHDHEMHEGGAPGCEIAIFAHIPDDLPWPECWIAAPDYWRHLPARIACMKFEACTEDGCAGDPGADVRPGYVQSILDDLRAVRGE